MDIKIKVKQNKHNIDVELKDTIVVYRESGREPQTKEVEYVENGEYVITPDEGYILEQANVNVNVPIPEGYIKPEGNMDITTTDEYDVSTYATAQIKDNNLIPENIAENVEVLGITGTFHGVVDTSDATATSDDILLYKTAYVDDKKIIGNIETWDGTFEGDVELYSPLNDFLRGIKTEITADDMQDVLAIGDYEFYKKPITSVEIGSCTTQIGQYAFSGTQLTSINIPDSVTSIGERAFQSCENLISVTLPKNISAIPLGFLNDCFSLKNINIPESVTTIGLGAFQRCKALSDIIIPSKVTSIGASAFQEALSLKNIVIPDSVTNIGAYVFYSCSGLEHIKLGNGISRIEKNDFDGCSSLLEATIGEGVESIGARAFGGCSNLKRFICLAETPPAINSAAFDGVPADCVFYVPATSVEAYKSATNWSIRADYIVAYEEGE